MEGMNGLELARQVHQKDPSVPVIIVTGYGPVDGGKDVNACLKKKSCSPRCWKRSNSTSERARQQSPCALLNRFHQNLKKGTPQGVPLVFAAAFISPRIASPVKLGR